MSGPEMFSLAGKKIVIAGASSGIGRAAAIAAAKFGAEVIGIGRNPERLAKVANELKSISPLAHEMIGCDLLQFDRIKPMMNEIVKKHGKLDGLLCAVGEGATISLLAADSNCVRRLFEENVITNLELVRCFSSSRCCNDRASLVMISSIATCRGTPGISIYGATKGALDTFVMHASKEFAPRGIRINSIAPGALLDTKMSDPEGYPIETRSELLLGYPLGAGKVDDLTGGIIYFLSDASRWVTGAKLVIDGGRSY